MATTAACCLNNLPTPPPPPKPFSFSSPNLASSWNRKEGSWRNGFVLGATAAMIALELGNAGFGETNAFELSQFSEIRNEKITKWSDVRTCPQWQLNSLEIVVPENLPRPSSRRRSEVIRHRPPTAAPRLQLTHSSSPSNGCFSM